MLKNFAWNRFIHNYLNSFKYIFSGTQETVHKGINKYLIYIRHIYLFNYIFYYLYDIKDILYYKGKETHKDELVKIINKIKSSFPKNHFFVLSIRPEWNSKAIKVSFLRANGNVGLKNNKNHVQ